MAYEDQPLDLTFGTDAGETSVYHVRNDFGDVMRVLEVEGSCQSACFLGDRYCDLVFEYTKRFDAVFEARPEARSVLVLGGGGFSYPKHLIATRPDCVVDVVEVDQGIVDVAYEFFYLDRLYEDFGLKESGRLSIFVEDARDYLRRCGRGYDAILCDCYSGRKWDEGLLCPDALGDAHRLLGREGIYASNVVSALEGDSAEPLEGAIRALRGEFAQAKILPVGHDDPVEPDNVIVLASDSAIEVAGAIERD
jgi:spermidine synthase